MQTLTVLIKTEFRFVESQFARVLSELDDLRTEHGQRLSRGEQAIEALPRAIAEMLTERDQKR